ncbi:Uu.00g005840.m01.CDS01 [Anthostomella pinea]|uniref:Uu.00g005840.m01.CDS01 n=1 Tax=Anthostomella pinea TaxID=933095 RepID=A0AAI8VK87_9PEZI|nr:Uu.00g005840.m01.CDS01 [Anthostomella pinea]
MPTDTHETSPLLGGQARMSNRTASGTSWRSDLIPSRLRTHSLHEVHPHPETVQPQLPASAIAPDHETDLHDTRWATREAVQPNLWASFRHVWKQEIAEFWGTFMIILFGAGVECQVGLHYRNEDHLTGRLAWGVGVACAVWISGGVSGGHCNPTVTLVLAIFRGFPLRKVPGFIVAQVLGAAFAALVVYANYTHSISVFEGGDDARAVMGPHATAGMFITFPAAHLTYVSAFYSEFLASAVLIALIFALADKGNMSPPARTQPFALFLVILGIGSALGVNTGYAINGARDTGPRIALAIVGYGSQVWTHNSCYFIWGPWIASMTGGLVGAFLYDASLYAGRDSPLNRPVSASKGQVDEEAVI